MSLYDLDREKRLYGMDSDSGPQPSGAMGGSSSFVSGGDTGSSVVGNGVSTAGVGNGGQGGWTNIQSYIQANKGDTGSSKLLSDDANKVYGAEMGKAQKGADDVKAQADSYNSKAVKTDDVDSYLNDSANGYQWGQQSDGYNNNANKVKGYLNTSYEGPKSYSYGVSKDFQDYGNGLKDDSTFDQNLQNLYGKASGSDFTSGQFNLQKQLDVNNAGLQDTRKNLTQKFDSSGNDISKVAQDTNSYLNTTATKYASGQNQLKDYLSGKTGGIRNDVSSEESKAKSGFDADKSQSSGRAGVAQWYRDAVDSPTNNKGDWDNEIQRAESEGTLNRNLNYNQLEKEQQTGDRFSGRFQNWNRDGLNLYRAPEDVLGENNNTLNSFYNSENQKYANAGDAQKRQYNTIADYLGQGDKYAQGFKVKG